MNKLLVIVSGLALLCASCYSSGEIVYTGANESAFEGDWIKDPEAVGTTKNSGSRLDTTRTESNRVDIPVLEFAQLSMTSKGATLRRYDALETRLSRSSYTAIRYRDFFERRLGVEMYEDVAASEGLVARRGATLYPGMYGNEELNYRSGRNRYDSFTGQEGSWVETGRHETEGMRSRAWLEHARSEAYLNAVRGQNELEAAYANRVVGLHLWKYADREIVTDAVEITYTLVYYNTNEYDTGPTEIDEPVPYYTEYIAGSATLPKQGTSVEFTKRDDNRNLLRWKFPQGIKAGETNSMKYKVRVVLDAPNEYRPPQDREEQPTRQ
jgi:hypothetical protein